LVHNSGTGSNISGTGGGRLLLVSHTAPLQHISSMIAALARAFNLRCDKTVRLVGQRSCGDAI
jgi:hypothetical protein